MAELFSTGESQATATDQDQIDAIYPLTYTVVKGDWIVKIARNHRVYCSSFNDGKGGMLDDVVRGDQIIDANLEYLLGRSGYSSKGELLEDEDFLKIGDQLTIPGFICPILPEVNTDPEVLKEFTLCSKTDGIIGTLQVIKYPNEEDLSVISYLKNFPEGYVQEYTYGSTQPYNPDFKVVAEKYLSEDLNPDLKEIMLTGDMEICKKKPYKIEGKIITSLFTKAPDRGCGSPIEGVEIEDENGSKTVTDKNGDFVLEGTYDDEFLSSGKEIVEAEVIDISSPTPREPILTSPTSSIPELRTIDEENNTPPKKKRKKFSWNFSWPSFSLNINFRKIEWKNNRNRFIKQFEDEEEEYKKNKDKIKKEKPEKPKKFKPEKPVKIKTKKIKGKTVKLPPPVTSEPEDPKEKRRKERDKRIKKQKEKEEKTPKIKTPKIKIPRDKTPKIKTPKLKVPKVPGLPEIPESPDPPKVPKIKIGKKGWCKKEISLIGLNGLIRPSLGVIQLDPFTPNFPKLQKPNFILPDIELKKLSLPKINLEMRFQLEMNKIINNIKTRLLGAIAALLARFNICDIPKAIALLAAGIRFKDLGLACPEDPEELKKLIQKRNKLTKAVNNIYKFLDKINVTVTSTQQLITVADALLIAAQILTFIPSTLATPIPSASSNIVEGGKRQLKKYGLLLPGIASIIALLLSLLVKVLQMLALLDNAIESCTEEEQKEKENSNPNTPYLGNNFNEQLIQNQLLLDTFQQSLQGEKVVTNVNGFEMDVITVDNVEIQGEKRRQAIAKNKAGVIMLRGEASFSSNDQILIDELVFYIQQNDLKAE